MRLVPRVALEVEPDIPRRRLGQQREPTLGLEREQDFVRDRASVPALSHRTAYQRAVAMMRSKAAKAFDVDEEPQAVRDAYGRTLFGRGCLLARRLVERGVPFVEVTLSSAPGLPAAVCPGWPASALGGSYRAFRRRTCD